ncbi:hypothetical protein [Andreprevotia chitinilytica]|uniref:hypothetical protein n=1 Tax=Andreprevotia chitinilytica TaxID=396808 RepID=UPI0012EBF4E2|nr:hypothetical protein [Andreprevotia chitinilytica]
MVSLFRIGHYSELKVWDGCSPIPEFVYSQQIHKSFEFGGHSAPILGGRVVVAEVYMPKGPRVVYGLLGCQFVPNLTGQLTVWISLGDSDLRAYADARCNGVEPIHLGIPVEFLDAIVSGVDAALKLGDAISGELTFCFGAFGVSSSNSSVFQSLANFLLQMVLGKELVYDTASLQIFE